MSKDEAIEIFINDFNIITDCLYDTGLTTRKSDELYQAMLLVKSLLEENYYDE